MKRKRIIAEIAQAHDGSLGMAHAFIDAVADTGADGIKFQTHIASAESTPAEPWRIRFSKQDDTRYAYWKRMEFSESQWHGLKAHADECGILFLSSVFSVEAVDLLERVGVAAWKIPSGEVANTLLFERILATNLPIWISSGMSTVSEVDKAVNYVKDKGNLVAVFQCTSMYPTPPEKIGLNMIPFFQQRYKCSVGLSDHSGTIYAGLAAASIGVDLLEVHVTFSHQMFGPDVPASISTKELKQLVDGVRFIEKINANPVDKDEIAAELDTMRKLFNKSLALVTNLPAGTVLHTEHLTGKKPGSGIPVEKIEEVIGRTLRHHKRSDELLEDSDFV